MKKIIACISLVFALSAGATALAADASASYADGNKASVTNGSAYSTVLITANGANNAFDTTDTIVYADQKDNDGFVATALEFALDADAAPGGYTVTTNNWAGNDKKTATFVIPEDVPEVKVNIPAAYTPVKGESTYNAGFKLENSEVKTYTKIIITASNGTATETVVLDESLPTLSGEGFTYDLGVKITEIPNNVTVTVGLGE